ncbi:MAG TPA: hypothetical protein VF133_10435 [Terriglobales bacterium]
MRTLNEVYSSLSSRRRYEVWFVRMGLADGSGAWWFRYLLTNPGRAGCAEMPRGLPVQVWATWFPREGRPQSFIQEFPLDLLELSGRGQNPFTLRVGENEIEQNSCRGALNADGHKITWNLHYRSTFRVTLSNKGWIGFSRTPHSNARFSGEITFDGQRFSGDPLGFGLQGHNCGYRHRGYWKWMHAYFLRPDASSSTLEALVYDMPFGLVFRKAVLWHESERYVFRNLQDLQGFGDGTVQADRDCFQWKFRCSSPDGLSLEANVEGGGSGLHRLQYVNTDCSGSFEVTNNSVAKATVRVERSGAWLEQLETSNGAVLEMAGQRVVGSKVAAPLPLVSESAQ